MRKYVIGFLVGALLTLGTSVYGADIASLVGKTVQGEALVSVDGANIGKIVIIDGKSYAPVRAIGESAGYSVIVNGKNVILSKQIVDTAKGDTMTVDKLKASLESATKEKDSIVSMINRFESALADPLQADKKSNIEKNLTLYKSSLDKIEQKIADLQAQLAELQAQ